MIGIIKAMPQLDYKIDIYIHNPEQNQKSWKKYTFNTNFSNLRK